MDMLMVRTQGVPMKRLIVGALAVSAVIAVPAQANHGKPGTHSPNNHSHSHSSKGRCGVVNRGFTVTGNNATFAVTQNTDGTWSGDVTLTATGANSHAHKSGVNSTDA